MPISNDIVKFDKRVLIIGAASGIGKAAALRFAREGWQVCISDIEDEKLYVVYELMNDTKHMVFTGDYSNSTFVAKLRKGLKNCWRSVDVIVCCAGIFRKSELFTQSINQWRSDFDIMVNGSLNISKLAYALLTDGGRIIYISSIHAQRAEYHYSGYSMAKAAIEQLCRSMALEFADRKILVNTIAPGFIATPMSIIDGVNELTTSEFYQYYIN